MATFEITLYSTSQLYQDCKDRFSDGFRARDLAKEFIDGAFDRSNNHNVDVSLASVKVQAPTELIHNSFEAPEPCHSGSDFYWPNLRDWWEYWIDEASCKDTSSKSKDCNLLLTAADGAGLGGPREACAGGAFHIADNYTYYQDWGTDSAFNKVDTLLEELGHTLIGNMPNKDDGTTAHDSGRLYEHSGTFAITPLGITGDTDYNNCNEFVDKSRLANPSDPQVWEARYSPCTEKHFSEKY